MSLDATALVTVAETKTQLNIPTADTSNDTELELYINAVTAVVEKHIGPVIDRAVTEVVPGGSVLLLTQPPVVSLTSVAGAYGDATTYTVGALYLDGQAGIVHAAYTVPCFVPRHLTVVYQAGRGATAPAAIKLAALITLQHLWETQRGGSPEALLQGEDDVAPFGFAFAVPNRALELLAPYARVAVA